MLVLAAPTLPEILDLTRFDGHTESLAEGLANDPSPPFLLPEFRRKLVEPARFGRKWHKPHELIRATTETHRLSSKTRLNQALRNGQAAPFHKQGVRLPEEALYATATRAMHRLLQR